MRLHNWKEYQGISAHIRTVLADPGRYMYFHVMRSWLRRLFNLYLLVAAGLAIWLMIALFFSGWAVVTSAPSARLIGIAAFLLPAALFALMRILSGSSGVAN